MHNAIQQQDQSSDGVSPSIQYPDHLELRRLFMANRLVRGARFWHTEVMLENGYDFLELYHANGGAVSKTGLLDSAANNSTNAWWEVPGVGQNWLSRTPAVMTFRTDYNGYRDGFRFTRVQLCCASNSQELAPIPIANMTDGARYTGTLIGPGDVVYFRAGAPTAGHVLHVNLWSMHTTNFDIKARCNALPTDTTYDFVSHTPFGRWEYLPITNTVAQCTGVIYIAVYSHTSSGSFNITASRAKASMMKNLRVGVEKTPTPAEWNEIDRGLRIGSRYYYATTEGQHIVNRFSMFPGLADGCSSCGGNKCDICLERNNRNGYSRVLNSCTSNSKMRIVYSDWGSPIMIAHELAHYLGCVPDEYCHEHNAPPGGCKPQNSCQWCSYSIVGHSGLDLCTHLNHREIHPHDQACTTGNIGATSMWERMSNIYFIPLQTPDYFNYENHHFNDYIFVW